MTSIFRITDDAPIFKTFLTPFHQLMGPFPPQGDLKVRFSPPVHTKQAEGVELLPLCVGEVMKGTVVSGLFQEYNV